LPRKDKKKQSGGPVQRHGIAFLLFFISFWAFTFFMNVVPAANVSTRMDLVSAIVRNGSFIIDEFQSNTIDKAYFDGHYYSDKPPGVSFSAVPVGWIYNRFRPAVPGDILFRFLATCFSVSLPSALLAVLFYLLAERITKSRQTALLCACALVFGTLLLPYSTLFYGHVPGVAISFILFYLACIRKSFSPALLFLCGALTAWMVITDYLVVFQAVALLFLFTVRTEKKVWMAAYAAGALAVAPVLLFYNYTAFGSIAGIGYMHEAMEQFREVHSTGFLGLTFPTPGSFYEILFSPGRGLFFISPFLFFIIPGIPAGIRDKEWKLPVIAAIFMVLAAVSINASFQLPGGGMSSGPRLLIPALPYMVFLCTFFLRRSTGAGKGLFAGLCAGAVFIHFIVTVTCPHAWQVFDFPAFEPALRMLTDGYIRRSWVHSLLPASPLPTLLVYFSVIAAGLAVSFTWPIKSGLKISGRTIIAFVAATAACFSVYTTAYLAQKDVNRGEKLYYLGYTYDFMKQQDLAEKAYRESISVDPSNNRANNALGIIEAERGNTSAAIEHFSLAVAGENGIASGYLNLSTLYFKSGRFEKAIENAKHLPEDNPFHLRAESILCRSYAELKRYREALPHCRAYISSSPQDYKAIKLYADILLLADRAGEAVDVYNRLIEALPGMAPAWVNLGLCYNQLGDNTRAVKMWRRALEIDPGNENAKKFLGLIHAPGPPGYGDEPSP